MTENCLEYFPKYILWLSKFRRPRLLRFKKLSVLSDCFANYSSAIYEDCMFGVKYTISTEQIKYSNLYDCKL